jgi:hypothetical protein
VLELAATRILRQKEGGIVLMRFAIANTKKDMRQSDIY